MDRLLVPPVVGYDSPPSPPSIENGREHGMLNAMVTKVKASIEIFSVPYHKVLFASRETRDKLEQRPS
ncbi:hypothetical protein CDAR_384921 [Caerostris darwini]|uniref:Uncharacterized protein n=1 Tax=Caerostris darwini TaxID=1538125 RepID=A0AAV4WCJ9_9ARAC|nr:hypothetical protein CDAR_384921 [Caerostris darwini]